MFIIIFFFLIPIEFILNLLNTILKRHAGLRTIFKLYTIHNLYNYYNSGFISTNHRCG